MTTEKTHHPLGIDPCDQQSHPIFNATTQKCNVVDTRTGLFEVYVPLPKITGNAGRGPVVDLGLFYTPVVNNHACLGDGWSFAFSFYNEKLKQLTLSTGEVLGFDRTQGGIEVSSISIRVQGPDTIKVVLANKSSEILKKLEGTELWMPVTLATPQAHKVKTPEAHKVKLRWQAVEVGKGHYVRLREVKDSARTLALIEYDEVGNDSSRKVRIKLWPDDEEQLVYELEQTNYALRSIKLPGHSEVKLGYDDHPDCGWLLNHIETFEGVKESVTYAANGIKFADEKLTRLPAVGSHTLKPLGENAVDVVTTYRYFPADKDASWAYKTAMKQGGNATTIYYGKDYSVVKEEEQEGGCTLNTSYEMESKDTGYRKIKKQYVKPVDNPAEPKREETQRTTWKLGKIRARLTANRESLYFVTGSRTPNKVNLLTNSLTKPTLSYFDYRKFKRFKVKRELSDDELLDARIKEFSKRMGKIPSTRMGKIPSTFLPGLKDVFTGMSETVHLTAELTRRTDSNRPAMLNCTELNDWLKPKTVALCMNHSGVGDPSWITVSHTYDSDPKAAKCSYGRLTGSWQGNIQTKYHYSLDGTELTVKTTQAIDKSSRESSETCSILSGRLIKQIDVVGNETRYEYDDVGRLKKFIQCAQSATYKQATEYLYPRTGRVESIEPNGQHRATEDDGQGNVLAEYVKDSASAQWRQMLKVEYDAQGRKSKTTQFDYDADGKQMSETCVLTYDGWGQAYKQEFSDGRCLFNEYDPVTLTRREWSGLADNVTRKVTTYNEDGSVANIAIGDASQAFEYTHAFQIARHVTNNEQEIRYSYDAAGRPLTESHGSCNPAAKAGEPFTPDYTYTYEYPQDVMIREASKISFDGHVLGERTFDAWGRVTSFTRGGVTEDFTYQGGASVPSTRKVADTTLAYTYIPELGNQIQRISTPQDQTLSKTFSYLHGATRDSSVSEGEQLLASRHDLNKHATLRRATINKKTTEVQRSFSPAGRLLTETDPAGRRIKYTYDAKGQRTKVEVDHKKVARHTYDKGLLSAEEVSHGEDSVKLSYEYDPSTQQETTRTFTLEGAFSLKLQRKFRADGKLRSISLSDANTNQTLGAHEYHYSPSGRLTCCTSSGIWQFKTPEGDAVGQQDFVYDGLGNVISCVTTFGNEHNTSTYTYDSSKGYRLIKVEHTHQDYRKIMRP
ncbi:RHS repeat domain-containing protein [Pseudomonas sp. NPDC087358]|uniref:RHS repeat domain-containing protein n=1 Tax=Pseudomonas sp. NPDC087358 TaxID=3364439 RepID=UPI00384EA3F3